MRQDAKSDTEEVKHRALSSNWSEDLSLFGNDSLSDNGFSLLLLDNIRGNLGLIQLFNERSVIQDSSCIGFLESIQKLFFEP